MLYVVECMAPTIFNWSEGLLVILKDQLTKFRRGELKKFGYGVGVVSFFLEIFPLVRPVVPLTRLDAEDPRMSQWVEAMARHGGGGGPRVEYGVVFFHWLRGQTLMVEDYAYAGIDFSNEPDLPLLEGDHWDE